MSFKFFYLLNYDHWLFILDFFRLNLFVSRNGKVIIICFNLNGRHIEAFTLSIGQVFLPSEPFDYVRISLFGLRVSFKRSFVITVE